MKYKSSWLIGLLLASKMCLVYAQQTRLRHLTTEDGLASDYVISLLQDRNGFVWIGSADGLTRYDGHHYKVFRSIPDGAGNGGSTQVAVLYEDRRGDLWVATNQGLNRYIPESESFENYSFSSKNAKKVRFTSVYSMYEDAKGAFWIASWNGGLYKMDREKGTFTLFQPYPDSIFNNSYVNTAAIYPDQERPDRLWVPFGVNGKWQLFSFNTSDHTFEPVDSRGLPYMGYIMGIKQDRDGLLWFSTSNGLRVFNPVSRSFEQEGKMLPIFQKLANTQTIGVLVDVEGRLWVGTKNEGVYVVDKKTGLLARYNRQEGMRTDKISCLLQGRTGEVWVGTPDDGLYLLNEERERFRHYKADALAKNTVAELVSAIYEDKQKNIWVGLTQGGLQLFNPSEGRLEAAEMAYPFLHGLQDDYIFSLSETNDGRLWIGTNGRGLKCVDFARKTLKTYQPQLEDTTSLCSEYVTALLKDRKGRLWIGTYGGLNLYDPATDSFRQYLSKEGNTGGLSSPYVFCLYEDKNGFIWVGTYDGMCVLDPGKGVFRQFLKSNPDQLSGRRVELIAVMQDSAGYIWAGTDGGLYRMRFPDVKNPFRGEPDTRVYTESDGLSRTAIQGLMEDRQGRIWISTLKGLSLFRNPRHEAKIAPDFRNYGAADGLLQNMFKNRANCVLRSGRFLFGGRTGILMFDPAQVEEETYRPSLRITSLEKFDSEQPEAPAVAVAGIPYRSEVALSYTNNIFSIGFTALDYLSDGTNRFAYRMRGFNDSWVQLGPQRKVTFTNLDPGTYVFEVRGTNRDGIWSDQTASLKIVIHPPWWKTWWAYVLYGLLFVGGLGVFIRARLHYMRQRTQQLEKAVQISTAKILAQKEQLEQQARELQDLDQLKSRFYTNITHELRTPLTMIVGPLESIQKSKRLDGQEKDLLKMARQNGLKLEKLIQAILDLSKLEAGKLELREAAVALVPLLRQMVAQFDSYANYLGVTLQFETTLDEGVIVLQDVQKLETIVNNLIANALKFTPPGGHVAVTLSDTPTQLCLQVADTGRGIHPEDLPHIFDRFYQTRRPDIPAEGGTGIGLALCSELARLFGGRIGVESVLGAGSTFLVEWPKKLSLFGLQETASYGIQEGAVDVPDFLAGIKPVSAQDRADTPRILVVEDNPDLQSYMEHLLAASYDLVLAGNGEEAIQLLDSVDLIISDVLMPRMDGFQLLEYLKTDDRYRDIPVIMLTARADMQDKLRALRTGVDDYLTKPFDEEELLARVRNLVQRRKNRLDAFSESEESTQGHPSILQADVEWLSELEQWMSAHLHDETLSVGVVARHFALSERQLLRRMRELTGLSPQQYIGELRLQKARESLERGIYRTVAEAAYAAGFRNAKAFSRAYRERFGRLPSSYF